MLPDYEPDDLDVRVSELLVATSDYGDDALDDCVQQVLRMLRQRLDMDVVFVAQIADGRRTFKRVDSRPGVDAVQPGAWDPVEQSWCQFVVDGRMPQLVKDAAPLQAAGKVPATPLEIGTHLSVPVHLRNGEVYGTLCCFSFAVNEQVAEADLRRLQYTAELMAGKIQGTGG